MSSPAGGEAKGTDSAGSDLGGEQRESDFDMAHLTAGLDVGGSAPGQTFDKEDATPRRSRGRITTGGSDDGKVRRTILGLIGARLGVLYDNLTKASVLPKLQKVFVAQQALMYAVWIVMWRGWVTNHILHTMQAICFAYMFVMLDQVRRMCMYPRMCARIKFTKGEEFDFYNRALAQLKFHGLMVLHPMVVMILDTLLFTYSFIEGSNYYNVRPPPAGFLSNFTLYNSAAQSSSRGCSDERALNYNPSVDIDDHDWSRCDFVRCHQDVYQFRDDWPIGIKVFTPLYLLVFFASIGTALVLSLGHLKYFEGLYMERYKALPFLKDMWRNAVSSYMVGTGRLEIWFAPERLRLFHVLLIVTQAILTAAMTIGKLAIQDNWFVEFDISVLLIGYEVGRHAPSMGFVQRSEQNRDIYLMTQRLNWHRESMYHYFILTAVVAYLSVSGGYRILPGDDYNSDEVLRENILAAFGTQSGTSPGIDWMLCPSGMAEDTRLTGALVISSIFVFLVGISAWLSAAHYLQYQSLKRDHTILLSFAAGFKNMLQRRRKRITYAYQDWDDSGPDLCPKGGFPVEHESSSALRKVRGKLIVVDDSISFLKAGGLEGVHTITYNVDQIIAVKQAPGTPPKVVITLKDTSTVTLSSQMAKSVQSSLERIIQGYNEGGRSLSTEYYGKSKTKSAVDSADKARSSVRRRNTSAAAKQQSQPSRSTRREIQPNRSTRVSSRVTTQKSAPTTTEPTSDTLDPMKMMMMQQQIMMQQMMANPAMMQQQEAMMAQFRAAQQGSNTRTGGSTSDRQDDA